MSIEAFFDMIELLVDGNTSIVSSPSPTDVCPKREPSHGSCRWCLRVVLFGNNCNATYLQVAGLSTSLREWSWIVVYLDSQSEMIGYGKDQRASGLPEPDLLSSIKKLRWI
jgi:hypothetical protein